jgi:hypothetical protein
MTTTYATTWLGAVEVEMLGISRNNVQAMAKAGTMPAYKFAKQ